MLLSAASASPAVIDSAAPMVTIALIPESPWKLVIAVSSLFTPDGRLMPGSYDRFEPANVICITLGKFLRITPDQRLREQVRAILADASKASPQRRPANNKSARWAPNRTARQEKQKRAK